MFDNGNFRRKRKRKADNVSTEKKNSSSSSSSSSPSSASSSEPSPKVPRMPCSRPEATSEQLPCLTALSLGTFPCHLQDSAYPTPPPPPPPADSPALYMHVPEHPSPPTPLQGHVSSFSPGAVVPQWDASSSSPPLYSSLHHSPPPLPLCPSSQQTFASLVDPHASSSPLYTDLQPASSLQPELQEAQQLLQLQAHYEPLFLGGFADALPLDALVLQQ